MKIFKITILILLIPLWVSAQSLNCPSTLKMRTATAPFKFNNLSKSAQCYTGKKYDFILTLTEGKEYRFSFFASAVFNSNIRFKLIDMNTDRIIIDIPGETLDNKKGTVALKPYYDRKRLVHPYFDIIPETTTKLKVMIDVASLGEKTATGYEARKKGCITVFIQDKKSEMGF